MFVCVFSLHISTRCPLVIPWGNSTRPSSTPLESFLNPNHTNSQQIHLLRQQTWISTLFDQGLARKWNRCRLPARRNSSETVPGSHVPQSPLRNHHSQCLLWKITRVPSLARTKSNPSDPRKIPNRAFSFTKYTNGFTMRKPDDRIVKRAKLKQPPMQQTETSQMKKMAF